jgi:predicted metal-dependent phosphoesterase TrpH
VLNGAEVSAQQERVALFLINKFCPNLQAIAIQMEHKRPETRQDISALLASTGIRPEQVWGALNGSAQPALEGEVVENSPEDQSVAEAPTHPDDA